MGLLVGLPLTLFRLLGSFLLLALRFAVPILIAAAVIVILRRLRKRADQGRTEDGEQEPKFHGPVYTVDYKEVDDEDEKGK